MWSHDIVGTGVKLCTRLCRTFEKAWQIKKEEYSIVSPAAINKRNLLSVRYHLSPFEDIREYFNNWICLKGKTINNHWTKQWKPAPRWMMQKYFEWSCYNVYVQRWNCLKRKINRSEFSLLWSDSFVWYSTTLSQRIINMMKYNSIIGSSFFLFCFCNTYKTLCSVSLIIIFFLPEYGDGIAVVDFAGK